MLAVMKSLHDIYFTDDVVKEYPPVALSSVAK